MIDHLPKLLHVLGLLRDGHRQHAEKQAICIISKEIQTLVAQI
jgi:hypothetical protein